MPISYPDLYHSKGIPVGVFPVNSPDLHASGAASIPDRYLAALDNDRHIPPAVGQLHHFIQLFGVLLDVIVSSRAVSLPGFIGVRSASLAVNDD